VRELASLGKDTVGAALLSTLSDDLALPLVQIKTTLELLDSPNLTKTQKQLINSLGLSTEAGLQLLEAYRLALSLADTTQLPLEPIAIGSVLNDVAHQLTPLARAYNTELWVDTQGSLKPALAHQPSLITALNCLGASLIRVQSANSTKMRCRILLGAHSDPEGQIITGVFTASSGGISQRALKAARNLSGKAHQPVLGVPTGTASGVLVADMLCSRIWQPLRATRHQNLSGLATLIPISKQLNFV